MSQRVIIKNGFSYDSLENGWYSMLSGNTLLAIPNTLDLDLDEVAENIDILILTGGNDTVVRKIIETKLSTKMLILGKPIIGVCHGAFLLTEIMGGDVSTDYGIERTDNEIISYKNSQIEVNSYHSNVILSPPEGCEKLCEDNKGYCESWYSKEHKIGAIVWHPERMVKSFVPDEIKELLNDKHKKQRINSRPLGFRLNENRKK